MKILLILPAAEHLRVLPHSPVPRRKMLRFSILPLTTLAALTPSNHTVEICDENVQPLDFDSDADIIGVTFMTALAPRAFEIAQEFRNRGKVVIAGGYHPTLCPSETLLHFNIVVTGEAEGVWATVLSDIENQCYKPLYQGGRADPKAIPIPLRELMKDHSSAYATINAVQAGRGCAHGCQYCSIAAFHQSAYRHREIDSIINELLPLPKHFMFVDDNIIADPQFAKALFARMIPLKKRWISQCSLKIADDEELLDLAKRAGCFGLFVGVETLSQENLESVNKGFNQARDCMRRIRRIRDRGIGVQAGIIVGMDADDPGVFRRTLDFLEEAGVDAIQLNIMTPLPGTPLYERMEKSGRILDADWSHYDFRHVVIQPKRMSQQQLQNGANWLYDEYYKPWRIARRAWRSMLKLGPLAAMVLCKVNMTYRYDNLRESIHGKDPSTLLNASQKELAAEA